MNIIITGASSGIGRALAYHYAKVGYTLFLIARRKEKLIEIQNELNKFCRVKIFEVDVSEFDKLTHIINNIVNLNSKIDLVIANAGVSLGHNSEFSNFKDFKKLTDINYLSIHALLSPIVPKMQKQKSGKIVVISSLASIISMPSSIAYSSSKRALNSYTEGLRNLLIKDNIKVINIQPGFIESEMTAKNSFKMPFFMSNENGVKRIIYAIDKNKKEYKFPKRFYYFIKFISILPLSLKDKIINKFSPKKAT